MPGILGTVCPDHSNKAALSAMFEVLRKFREKTQFDYQHSIWKNVSLGSFSNRSFAEKKKIFQSEDIIVVFDGILFNEQEFNITKSKSFAETIFELYTDIGETFVSELRGHFVIAILDLREHILLLYTDHFATKPIYYFQENKFFYFCSELKGLLPVGLREKQVNHSALINVFAFGYVIGNQTIYENIQKLPEGSFLCYNFQNSTVRINKYYEIPTEPVTSSESKLLDDLHELFDQAVNRILTTTVQNDFEPFITLSGGLDSRAVVASAAAQGFQPLHTVGLAESNSGDEKYAKKVAQNLKTNHQFIAYNRGNWLVESLDRTNATSELMYHYIDAARMLYLLDTIDSNKYGILHTGMLGDSLMGSHITPQDLKQSDSDIDLDALAQAILNRLSFGKFPATINFLQEIADSDTIIANIKESILESLLSEYSDLKNWVTAFHHWDIRNRQRAILGYARGIEEQMEFSSPFYDVDFFNLAVRIPSELKVNRKLYYRLLKRRILTAELASIPIDDKGVALHESDLIMLWMSRLKKGIHLLSSSLHLTNGKLSTSKPYFVWLESNRTLREELLQNLKPLQNADILGIHQTQFNNHLDNWTTNPKNQPHLGTLNLFYLASMNRWLEQVGEYNFSPVSSV